MPNRSSWRLLARIALGCALFAAAATLAQAKGESVLYSFTGGNDGGNAATGLAFDASGNAYGTTVVGGTAACGTVFRLSPGGRSRWQESVLYNFSCYADGKNPHGGVTVGP